MTMEYTEEELQESESNDENDDVAGLEQFTREIFQSRLDRAKPKTKEQRQRYYNGFASVFGKEIDAMRPINLLEWLKSLRNPNFSVDFYRKRVYAVKQEYNHRTGKFFDKMDGAEIVDMYLKEFEHEIESHKRHNVSNKFAKGINSGYSPEIFLRVLNICYRELEVVDIDGELDEYTMENEMKNLFLNIGMFKGNPITTLLEFIVGDYSLVRHTTKQSLLFEDFELFPLAHKSGHLSAVKCLSFIRTEQKTNFRSEYGVSVIARNKDATKCMFAVFAMHLFSKFQYSDPTVLPEHEQLNWLKEPVFNYSYGTARKVIKDKFDELNVEYSKATHIFRLSASRNAQLSGVPLDEIRLVGSWDHSWSTESYLLDVALEYLYYASGFEKGEAYFIARDVTPDEVLQKKLWPWLEKFEEMCNSKNTEEHKQAKRMIGVLKCLRSTFFQDMAVILDKYKNFCFQAVEPFNSDQFKLFQKKVLMKIQQNETSLDLNLENVPPKIERSLQEVRNELQKLSYKLYSLDDHVDKKIRDEVEFKLKLERKQGALLQCSEIVERSVDRGLDGIKKEIITTNERMQSLESQLGIIQGQLLGVLEAINLAIQNNSIRVDGVGNNVNLHATDEGNSHTNSLIQPAVHGANTAGKVVNIIEDYAMNERFTLPNYCVSTKMKGTTVRDIAKEWYEGGVSGNGKTVPAGRDLVQHKAWKSKSGSSMKRRIHVVNLIDKLKEDLDCELDLVVTMIEKYMEEKKVESFTALHELCCDSCTTKKKFDKLVKNIHMYIDSYRGKKRRRLNT